MGGYGSGRKGHRFTTSDYHCLDINKLRKKGTWKYNAGVVTWQSEGQKTAGITYVTCEDEIILSWNNKDNATTEQRIGLVTTPQHLGNDRFYFRCRCGRKAFKLYAGKRFYCRHCYNLTYDSCNESGKSDKLARLLGMNKKLMKYVWAYENLEQKYEGRKISQKKLESKYNKILEKLNKLNL